jgi:hypothetical protein
LEKFTVPFIVNDKIEKYVAQKTNLKMGKDSVTIDSTNPLFKEALNLGGPLAHALSDHPDVFGYRLPSRITLKWVKDEPFPGWEEHRLEAEVFFAPVKVN